MSAWTEGVVARYLARNTFANALCVVDRTSWTGFECDMLVVTPGLRVVDVEIKISRGDLKADAKKDKWWHWHPYTWGHEPTPRTPRAYPPRVWKHYYAMPADMWSDELLAYVQPASGVLLLSHVAPNGRVRCMRRATPNRNAEPITAESLRQVARLASLRMWDAYRNADKT